MSLIPAGISTPAEQASHHSAEVFLLKPRRQVPQSGQTTKCVPHPALRYNTVMKKHILIGIVVAAFIMGAVFGVHLSMKFYSSFDDKTVYNEAIVNARFALNTLYHLRDNKTLDAIERQERFLDSQLLSFTYYNSVSIDERDEGIIRTIEAVREYRSEYPRKTDSPDIDKAVQRILSSNFITNSNP